MTTYWDDKTGVRRLISEQAGITESHLSNVLHRKTGVSAKMAVRLAQISAGLGHPIPREDWVFNKTTTHPAFFTEGR